MMKEKYMINTEELSFNLVQTKLESVRKKNITRNGYRVYQDGLLGVSGALGSGNDEAGFKEAEQNLSLKIEYPFEATKGIVKTRDLTKEAPNQKQMIEDLEAYLEECRKLYPEYIFSNKINWIKQRVELTNESGTQLVNVDEAMLASVILKHVNSINIFDSAIEVASRKWDMELLRKETKVMIEGMRQEAELDEDALIVMQWGLPCAKIIADLSGKALGYGTSMFKDQLHKQVFSPDFSLVQTTDEERLLAPFFDAEGTLCDHELPLIDHGTIVRGYTDKDTAKRFGYELSGAADCEVDDIPTLSIPSMTIVPSQKTLKELLNGRKGILIIAASGGDT